LLVKNFVFADVRRPLHVAADAGFAGRVLLCGEEVRAGLSGVGELQAAPDEVAPAHR
jgi:hypothetical protein